MKKVTRKAIRKLQQFMERKGLVELPYTNLKLYDVAFRCKNDEIFNSFCEYNFEMFSDFLEDKNLKLKPNGNTSSFYIVSKYYESVFERNNFNKYNFYFDYIGGDLYLTIENEKESDLSEYDKNIMDREIKDFKESMIDVLSAYKYIEDFKKNQIEIYNEWLELNSEELN